MNRVLWALTLFLLFAGAVQAQTATLKILAQNLPDALHSLSSQTGIQLLFNAEDMRSLHSRAVEGPINPETALDRLLADTPYTYEASSANTYVIKTASAFYGLTMRDLSEQVRHGFFGLEVQRYFQWRDEIRVMLRFPPEDVRTLDHLQSMPIRLPNGDSVPFSAVAKAEYATGYAVIKRTNRERFQLISAEVYQGEADVENILADMRTNVIPQLKTQFPGLEIIPGQSRQKQQETLSAVWLYGALALLGIYVLLAVPLRSYIQPLIIMLAIPFGFVGAVLGHVLMQIPLSLESYFALFAVGGIVINDSLILLAQINKNRWQKMSVKAAVIRAGRSRFRAIFLTTVTTFAGLLPLIATQGYDAEKIMPMAVTIAFGVLFAFFVTLFLVPAVAVVFSKKN